MNDAKNCQINIWNEQGCELDDVMLQEVMKRVSFHAGTAKLVDIYTQEREPQELPEGRTYHRNPPGWIEWLIRINYHTGGSITIGAIQRELGAKVEFHS